MALTSSSVSRAHSCKHDLPVIQTMAELLLQFTVIGYLRFFKQYTKIGDGNMGQKDIAEKNLENYNDVTEE